MSAEVIPFPERRRPAEVIPFPPEIARELENLPDDPSAREHALDLLVIQCVALGIVPPLPSPVRRSRPSGGRIDGPHPDL